MRKTVVLFVLILTGCQYDPYTSIYTKAEPKADDVVGVYVPNQDTITLVTRDGHYPQMPALIVLSSNGTLEITNIPDWWLTGGNSQGNFDSGHGTWKIKKHQDWWAVAVSFSSTEQFALQQHHAGSFGTDMMLAGEKPPYKIILTIGDPDEGKAMQFEKAASQ